MRFNKRTKVIAKSICILIVSITLFTKIIQVPDVISQMEAVGVKEMLPFLIILETCALILYIIPRTAHIGFLLLIAYYGGAIGINLSQPVNTIPALVFMIIIWITTYIRKPEMFGLGQSGFISSNEG